ncbi:MAG: tRNA (N6-isopentenyl adenosine(37)-C2)-methylthiotransferase MiaB [Parcubacteria group bacterium GW2011_GWA2_38_13b]|nr:MAG: tRNA (N6-isopentenyl adenosine(37)-C2)-methylthiotransferase MiaB [Parcubacteria group bacterium GW2011_GWA2_38_13b]
MKYRIITFGCQTNQSDSERIAAILNKIGFEPALSQDDADFIIANACSVRQSAIDRIHGIAHKIQKKKKRGEKTPIAVLTGCVLEQDRKKLAGKFDIILDIRDIKNLPYILKTIRGTSNVLRKIQGRATMNNINRWKTAEKSTEYFKITPSYKSPFSAFVPIMTGCNNFCTYCAVPYTRGKEISRPVKDVINEIKNLIKKGYKEITLLGQNVNSYKYKIPKSKILISKQIQKYKFKIPKNDYIDFATLLFLINAIPGDFWIRFHSSHPKDFTDELIDAITSCEKVTKYISLPVQAGNDKVLKRMNRPYTISQYKKLVNKIRKKIPDASISTDFIVGFPGETKKQFQDSIKLFKNLKFDMAYIAQYSPRPGTAAERIFKDSVPIKEKKRRDRELTTVLKKTSLNINKKLVRTTQQVLIEKEIKRQNEHWLIGKTRGFKTVKIPITPDSSEKLIGNFADVKITKALDLGLIGQTPLK